VLSSSEPFVLLLTGVALLSLARLGPPRRTESGTRRAGIAPSATRHDPVPPAERAA
jgi:hypothetical protein